MTEAKNAHPALAGLVGDIQLGRKNLGDEMPVFLYRLLQYALRDELTERCGKEAAAAILRAAGRRVGVKMARNMLDLSLEPSSFLAHLQSQMLAYKMGILRVEEFDATSGHAVLTIAEDLDCSGLPVLGETVCNYDEGLLCGILSEYADRSYEVREVDCWAMGDRVCRFDARAVEG